MHTQNIPKSKVKTLFIPAAKQKIKVSQAAALGAAIRAVVAGETLLSS